MNSKNYSVYAKNKNNIEENLYEIDKLVVGNILKCEKNQKGTTYASSPVKYIFEKSTVNERNIYRDALSGTEIKCFDDPYIDFNNTNLYVTNIENLTDYINIKSDTQNTLLNSKDILDMQEAVNMIAKQENKNKIKQKSL